MSAGPAAPGPRLVYDADSGASEPSAAPPRRDAARRPWLIVLLVAVALLAIFEWRRAAALEARVEVLSAALATAEAEIVARRQQLDAIRTSVEDVRARVDGLAELAAEEPVASPAPPSAPAPAH